MAINYKRTNWVDEVTPLDADNMNNIEDAIVALSSMKIPSNFSDGTGKGSVVQIGNVANGESSAAFGVGNTATSFAQLIGGMYSKVGENGIAGMQNDSTLLVRIGYGTEGNEKTAFSIGLDGTTCMRRGAVVTGSISEDYHIINRGYADSRYLQKSGGTVSGNVTIQGNLTVAGTTTTETEKQLLVEANVIATNANKQSLGALLSGLAINKNANDTYGLMYDPTDDTVKFGQGTLDTNSKFIFSENEGRPIAIRDDSDKFTDGHFVKWQASSNSFVDAGVDEKTVRPTIGSIGEDQNVLSSITYTPESSIPTSAIEGVEYACTDLIGEGDLDGDLQTKINSALTQTTADERYVKKSEQGGVDWKMYSALVPENKILMWEIHVNGSSDGLDGWLYLRQLTSSYYSVSVSARGGTAGGVACMSFAKEADLWTAFPTNAYVVAGTTISSVTTSNITCTITRVLVNE